MGGGREWITMNESWLGKVRPLSQSVKVSWLCSNFCFDLFPRLRAVRIPLCFCSSCTFHSRARTYFLPDWVWDKRSRSDNKLLSGADRRCRKSARSGLSTESFCWPNIWNKQLLICVRSVSRPQGLGSVSERYDVRQERRQLSLMDAARTSTVEMKVCCFNIWPNPQIDGLMLEKHMLCLDGCEWISHSLLRLKFFSLAPVSQFKSILSRHHFRMWFMLLSPRVLLQCTLCCG